MAAVAFSPTNYDDLLHQYFGAQFANAQRIMLCESGGNAQAVSSTNDHGLFQIHNGLALYGPQIYDPAFNIALAYRSYFQPRGWQPWTCAGRLGLR